MSKNKISKTITFTRLFGVTALLFISMAVGAGHVQAAASSSSGTQSCANATAASKVASCQSPAQCPNNESVCCVTTQSGHTTACSTTSNSIINNYLNPIINFLAAGVGIIVVIMVVVGGVQYTASGGDPNAAAEARKRITNGLIALVTFAFMYSILEFIIPGGVFH